MKGGSHQKLLEVGWHQESALFEGTSEAWAARTKRRADRQRRGTRVCMTMNEGDLKIVT